MADHQETFSNQCVDAATPKESPEIAKKPEERSITNIYYDCLERIFDFLDLESLLNLAQTCKRLQIAAVHKFNEDYSEKQFILQCIHTASSECHEIIEHDHDDVDIIGMKLCLPFLRVFGAKLKYIQVIMYTGTVACNSYIDQYLNRYCADNVVDLEYELKNYFVAESMVKPFRNLHTLIFQHSSLKQMPNFVDWFPQVTHFEIDDCSTGRDDFIAATLPKLEHLQLAIDCGMSEKNVINILRANKHLRCLDMYIGNTIEMTMTQLLNMINTNKSLTTVKLLSYEGGATAVNRSELLRFVKEHRDVVELDLSPYVLSPHDAITFIDALDSLKSIQFLTENRDEFGHLLNRSQTKWKHSNYAHFDHFKHHLTLQSKHNN